MVPLSQTFDRLSRTGEKALVLFVTAGDPDLAQLPAILDCLAEAGADVIEVGIPFSDPIADGPTIQASSQRALDQGVTPHQVLETLGGLNLSIPVVAMGYINNALSRGLEVYAGELHGAGVGGTIMCDLTVDEAGDWIAASRKNELDNIFLVAPTSTEERVRRAAEASTGFVYAVSRTGVTGVGQGAPTKFVESEELVKQVRAATATPVCVGFGISSPEDVREVCTFADGAIVGSWLVQELAENWNEGRGAKELAAKVRLLKSATRG